MTGRPLNSLPLRMISLMRHLRLHRRSRGSVVGAGSVDSNGYYTAPSSGPANDVVTAAANSVAGTASANVILSVINGTTGNDVIRLIRSGANLLVYINSGTPIYNVSFGSLSFLNINGGSGVDSINLDSSAGASPVPSGGISVNGSSGVATLILTGTTAADAADVYANQIIMDGPAITYSSIANIIFNGNGGSDTLIQLAQPGNGATLTFNGSTSGGPSSTDNLDVDAGTYTFAKPAIGGGIQPISLSSLTLGDGASVVLSTAAGVTDRSVLVLNSLSEASTSVLDLGSNDLILHNSNTTMANLSLSLLTQAATWGFNAGGTHWQGHGIISSSAATDNSHLMALGVALNSALSTFDSQSVSSTDVLVKYTYYGDMNLDGKVDGSDYSRIDNGFLLKLTRLEQRRSELRQRHQRLGLHIDRQRIQ